MAGITIHVEGDEPERYEPRLAVAAAAFPAAWNEMADQFADRYPDEATDVRFEVPTTGQSAA